MVSDLFRSPLYDDHVSSGAVMAEEAGWEIPLHYGDPAAEAARARAAAGVADVTHLGRIRVRGDGAGDLVGRLCGDGALRQEDDTVRPVIVRDAGGRTLDTARLVRLEGMWLLLTSPAGRTKVLAYAAEAAAATEAKADDQTDKTVMIAVVGPLAAGVLDAVLPIRISDMADGAARTGSVIVARYIALRSDIGSLWRMEVILPTMLAGRAWRFITEKAGPNRIAPCGWAAMKLLQGES